MQMYVFALTVCLGNLPMAWNMDSAAEPDPDLPVVVCMAELLQEAMTLARNLAELNPPTSREWHMRQHPPPATLPACLAQNVVVSWYQQRMER